MAGHPEQAFVVYLPEPIFRSSISNNLELHALVRQDATWTEYDCCGGIQPDLQHADCTADHDVEMLSGDRDEPQLVNSLPPNLEDIKHFAASSDLVADHQPSTHPTSGRGLRMNPAATTRSHRFEHDHLHGARRVHQPATQSDYEQPQTQMQTAEQHAMEVLPADFRHPQMNALHAHGWQYANPHRSPVDMQMVIRSERAMSARADLLASAGSVADQNMFDAMIAGSEGIDEDVLVVNHPCRFYDVANFLGRWAVERYSGRTCLPLEVGSDRKIQQVDQKRTVFGHGLIRRDDMQGISWEALGTTRNHALEARRLLYSTTPGNQARSAPGSLQHPEQRYYRFRAFHARHRARFAHYQLRNVLTATSRNNIYYAAGCNVSVASLAFPDVQSNVLEPSKPASTALPFHVTTLSSSTSQSWPHHRSDSVLIAGGFNGEYAILNLDSDQPSRPIEGFVSNDYNGLVTHISTNRQRRSGGLEAVFSANDCRVRTMDISTHSFTSDFAYATAINATATSPDGRLRLLVGDSCEPSIIDAEKGSTLVTLSSHTNFGFACAWSRDGRYAATGAQDGRVNVWDSRCWRTPVDTLGSEMSCVRSLHFTNDNILVMPENDDVIGFWHVQQRRRQNVRFFGSIAGVAVLNGGEEIVVANADRTVGGLMVFAKDDEMLYGGDVYLSTHGSRQRTPRARMSEIVQDLVL